MYKHFGIFISSIGLSSKRCTNLFHIFRSKPLNKKKEEDNYIFILFIIGIIYIKRKQYQLMLDVFQLHISTTLQFKGIILRTRNK